MLRQGIDVTKAELTEREGIRKKRGKKKKNVPLFLEASCDRTAQMPILTKAEARNTKLGSKQRGRSVAALILEVVQWKFKTT